MQVQVGQLENQKIYTILCTWLLLKKFLLKKFLLTYEVPANKNPSNEVPANKVLASEVPANEVPNYTILHVSPIYAQSLDPLYILPWRQHVWNPKFKFLNSTHHWMKWIVHT